MKSNIKIHTSFVSPVTLDLFIRNNYLPIFIIRSIGNSELIGRFSGTAVHFKQLSPSAELFRAKRDLMIDFTEFSKRYIIELSSNIDFQEIIEKLEYLANLSNARGVVLLGYGSDNTKCHRSILAELFNSSGYLENKVTEFIL